MRKSRFPLSRAQKIAEDKLLVAVALAGNFGSADPIDLIEEIPRAKLYKEDKDICLLVGFNRYGMERRSYQSWKRMNARKALWFIWKELQ